MLSICGNYPGKVSVAEVSENYVTLPLLVCCIADALDVAMDRYLVVLCCVILYAVIGEANLHVFGPFTATSNRNSVGHSTGGSCKCGCGADWSEQVRIGWNERFTTL
jgi:hypothetical protein